MRVRLFWMSFVLILAMACGETAVVEEPAAGGEETAVSSRQEAEQPAAEIAAPDPVFIPLTDADVNVNMQVILASSEIVVGENRSAAINPQLVGEVLKTDGSAPDGSVTLFTVNHDFAKAGNWGVEVQARFPDQTAGLQRVSFTVAESSAALLPGTAAPSVDTPTLASSNDALPLLSTAEPPNPAFYELSLADALANEKPTLIYMGTPAFCSSRVCGPGYGIYNELYEQWGDEVNFIQVEVFEGLPDPSANGWTLTEAMTSFGLTTEPWLYFIDSDGMIQYRIEGLFGVEEVSQQLATLP